MKDQWTFLTNHGHIILYLSKYPHATVREISDKVGITERAVLKIIADLVSDNYIEIVKNGRNNTYSINTDKNLRHELEKQCQLNQFIKLVKDK
jgi:predicted transcriptional regulator